MEIFSQLSTYFPSQNSIVIITFFGAFDLNVQFAQKTIEMTLEITFNKEELHINKEECSFMHKTWNLVIVPYLLLLIHHFT